MDIYQVRFEFEFSKEYLLETILKSKEEWNSEISKAVKEFVKNYDKYSVEKRRALEDFSNAKSNHRLHIQT